MEQSKVKHHSQGDKQAINMSAFFIFNSVARKVLALKNIVFERCVDYHSSDILWHFLRTADMVESRARDSSLNQTAIQYLEMLLDILKKDFPDLVTELEGQISRYHYAVYRRTMYCTPKDMDRRVHEWLTTL